MGDIKNDMIQKIAKCHLNLWDKIRAQEFHVKIPNKKKISSNSLYGFLKTLDFNFFKEIKMGCLLRCKANAFQIVGDELNCEANYYNCYGFISLNIFTKKKSNFSDYKYSKREKFHEKNNLYKTSIKKNKQKKYFVSKLILMDFASKNRNKMLILNDLRFIITHVYSSIIWYESNFDIPRILKKCYNNKKEIQKYLYMNLKPFMEKVQRLKLLCGFTIKNFTRLNAKILELLNTTIRSLIKKCYGKKIN